MKKQTAENGQMETPHERGNLDRQYGDIGISAVAAALPYCRSTKNPAYAPSREQSARRSEFDTRSIFAD